MCFWFWQCGCCWQWFCKQLGSAATQCHCASTETTGFVDWQFMQKAVGRLKARQDAGCHTPGWCWLSIVILPVQEWWFTICVQPCLGLAQVWSVSCPSSMRMGVTACPHCGMLPPAPTMFGWWEAAVSCLGAGNARADALSVFQTYFKCHALWPVDLHGQGNEAVRTIFKLVVGLDFR